MSPLLFASITLIVAIIGAALVTYLADGFAGYMTFILCVAGSIILAAILSVNARGSEVDATRAAIEDRYGVDFSTGSFGFGNATFVKGGALYTCTVTGSSDEARMFCDEPPRAEFAH